MMGDTLSPMKDTWGPETEFLCQSKKAKHALSEDTVELPTCSGFCYKVLDLVPGNLVPNHGPLTLLQKPCTQGHTLRHSKVNLTMK